MNLRHMLIALLLVPHLMIASCSQDHNVSGVYRAIESSEQNTPVKLLLKNDGKGSWNVHREDVIFRWEKRGNTIWLHSKSGGVITGTVDEHNSIHLTLPGVGDFHFQKIQE